MYRWVDHTAELELHVEAATPEEVFAEATAALGELLGEEPAGEPASHRVSASARDRPALLAEWLSELVFLAETAGFIPERVEGLELRDEEVEATVDGRRGSPPHLVKAVTYHRLAIGEEEGTWRARVIFDV